MCVCVSVYDRTVPRVSLAARCRVSAVASVALPSPHEALELQRSGKSYVFYCLRDVCWRLVVGCCCLILLVVRCRMLDIVGGWLWLVVVGCLVGFLVGWLLGCLLVLVVVVVVIVGCLRVGQASVDANVETF